MSNQKPKHTPGPWRWELSECSRRVHLVGGKNPFDLTVVDFVRWGMNGATLRLRDTSHPDLQIMRSAVEWGQIVAGREHHADWFKELNHPDARLIAAAPELLDALHDLLIAATETGYAGLAVKRAEAAIAKAEGAE